MMISIIIPAYNVEKYIGECLASVKTAINNISNCKEQVEVIVVDDASTDNTQEIVRNFREGIESLRIVSNRQNMGLASARNVGVEKARGTWVLFLDGDNMISPNSLVDILELIDRYSTVDVFNLGMVLVNDQGVEIGEFYGDHVKINPQEVLTYQPWFLLIDNFLDAFSLVKRQILSIEKFDVTLPYVEDWDLWIRLKFKLEARFRFVSGRFGAYRLRDSSLHSQFGLRNPTYLNAVIQVYSKIMATNMLRPINQDISQRIIQNLKSLSVAFCDATGYNGWI